MRIGALARMSDVAADTEVRRRFPVVAEALLFSASGQLRNMASIGGNIMQRTRCAFFRDETDGRCNKRRPGSGCAALHGLNRNHANSDGLKSCVATNPSDLAVALAAMDALVIVRGKAGERLMLEFWTSSGRPILLIHGFTNYGLSWAPQLAALVHSGYRVILPDLHGHGASSPATALCTVSDLRRVLSRTSPGDSRVGVSAQRPARSC